MSAASLLLLIGASVMSLIAGATAAVYEEAKYKGPVLSPKVCFIMWLIFHTLNITMAFYAGRLG